ncbi:PIN domain protein [Mycobacterium kansasii]|uniref:Ribonuclease VapC n=1 Tax=Mycobacterium kansasii TaxID=1768 RepID=A0A1V3WG91_MYCKA|nr:PIN domain protein [Mycobacterium kansasii]
MIVDAGPLIAYGDADDAHHATFLEFLESHPGPFIVPVLVIPEAAHVLLRRVGVVAEQKFLNDLDEDDFQVEQVEDGDWPRIRELVAQYRGFPLGTVDASVVAAAERLEITEVATVDLRHFRAVEPTHCQAFTLLPYDA